jgi:hypothetical protein
VLGPIIINIIAFHAFVAREGVFAPTIVVICLFTLFLVWVERAAFAAFLGWPTAADTQVRAQREEQAAGVLQHKLRPSNQRVETAASRP